jgi:hypothetical protein
MAQITLNHPIAEIHGSLSKRSNIVNRQKKYRVNGRVIHEGKQEGYAVRNPRDYKKKPPQGAELEHINLFRQACLITKEILDAEKPEETPIVAIFPPRPKYLTKEEALSLLADYRKRYKAQLPNTRGTHPDPEAPIDKLTLAPKRYARLDNFIRSMVYQSLKADQSTQQPED